MYFYFKVTNQDPEYRVPSEKYQFNSAFLSGGLVHTNRDFSLYLSHIKNVNILYLVSQAVLIIQR